MANNVPQPKQCKNEVVAFKWTVRARALGVLLPCCFCVCFFLCCITFTTAAQTEHCWRQFSNLSTDRCFFLRCFLRVYAIVIRCFTCPKHPTNKSKHFSALLASRGFPPPANVPCVHKLFSSFSHRFGSRICSFLAFRSRAPIISHIIVLRLGRSRAVSFFLHSLLPIALQTKHNR